MAEQEQEPKTQETVEEEEENDNPNYKAPAPKAIDEIINQDADDESLVKYKEKLLGGNPNFVLDPNNPNKVIIQKLSLLVDGREDVSIDLTKSKEELKKECFTLKEGVHYKIKIYFYVQREIVSGLKYEHKVHKASGLASALPALDKMCQMMGSYGPKPEMQSYTTQEQEAPKGMIQRGEYKISSKFVDDDKFEYANWQWHLAVKKDW